MPGGDDLEDDFVVDELVALSEDEAFIHDDDFNNQEDEDEETTAVPLAPSAPDNSVLLKKRKRREKEKVKRDKKRKLAEADEPKPQDSITAQSSEALYEYLSMMQKKTFKDMSDIELEDIRIPSTSVTNTSTWTGPRSLAHLTDFIIEATPTLRTRLAQRPKSTGAPTLLFLTGAALRVADVTRILRDKRLRGEKGGEIAKLFAKRIKLSEHVNYLRRTTIGAAAGTPGRIGKLLSETGSLSVSALSHIILDITFRDAKNRNLLDIPETRDEVFKSILSAPTVMKAIKEGKVQVVLF